MGATAKRREAERGGTAHPAAPARPAYERDLASWALTQAALLRAGRLGEVDAGNVAEELDALGRSEFDGLVSALRVVLMHMLKWDHQPERRGRSWVLSILVHRDRARDALDANPSFVPRLHEALARAHRDARREAAAETGLHPRSFPEACPYDLDAVMTRDHPLPEAP